jgi:hypothetical protein
MSKANNKFFLSKLTPAERKVYRRLSSPVKIQDFLNSLPINFEQYGSTCHSPRQVLQNQQAHCLEGALLAAAILQFHGYKPLLLDLRPFEPDEAHVVALFQVDHAFGAISKTNHAVLRFREPVYRNVRELVMSYFHEYFLDNGRKLLHDYAVLDLSRFNNLSWQTATEDLWYIDQYLNKTKHYKLLTAKQEQALRLADPIEIAAGKIVEWPQP